MWYGFPPLRGVAPIVFFLLLALRVVAAEPLRNVAQIRALSLKEADRGLPAQIEGVVTYFDPKFEDLFVQDATATTFVGYGERTLDLKPGDRIRIEGVTAIGGYYPVLLAKQIEVIGQGPLPQPPQVREENLLSPTLDSQWVEIPAIVTGVEIGGRGESILLLDVHGWKMKAAMPQSEYSVTRAASLMQRRVRIHAVAGTTYNSQRQMTGRFFFIPSFEQITATDAPNAENAPALRKVTELLAYQDTAETVVAVEGVVTQATDTDFYLRDSSGSVLVQAALNNPPRPGARVRAEGIATIAPYRPVLKARQVAVLGQEEIPAPFPLDLQKLARFHAELVTVEAVFLAKNEGASNTVLQLRNGEQYFTATLPAGSPSRLAAGDTVKLTGICELTASQPTLHSFLIDSFTIHLPQTGGIEILKHAPWWTLRRVLMLLGAVSALALLSLAWIGLLQRRVRRQTAIIGAHLQHVAVLNERQRIAQDLHDTVEQELTGVLIHLGAIAENLSRRLAGEPDEAGRETLAQEHSKLELAQRMLRHCREEARVSVQNLRSIELEQKGLAGALQEVLPPVAQACGAKFEWRLTGSPHPLEAVVEHHLLRIAQEATANAAHHAAPTLIAVHLDYTTESVTLEIRDDGCGFDPNQAPPRGHFGLRGIRQRADKIGATLRIESTPGKGTAVRVTRPLKK